MLKILFFYSTLKIVGFEFQEFAPEDIRQVSSFVQRMRRPIECGA